MATDSGVWLLSWPDRRRRFLAANLRPIGWSAAGDWVYASARGTHAREIVRISVATGQIQPVVSFPRGAIAAADCVQTPDWRAVICAVTESSRDAWMIEGLKAQ